MDLRAPVRRGNGTVRVLRNLAGFPEITEFNTFQSKRSAVRTGYRFLHLPA